MPFFQPEYMSNEEIDGFRKALKNVENPKARWIEKPGRHEQRNYIAETADGSRYRIYQRKNIDDKKDFSCGLALLRKCGKPFTLVRYNGSNHPHGDIHYRCHIHRTRAEAIIAGIKIDSFAEKTDRYRTMEGAWACLLDDCKVVGLTAQYDHPELFDGP